MNRIATFVDGSNLDGLLNRMNLRVQDFGTFFRFLIDRATVTWRTSISSGHIEPVMLQRVYWYRVGSIDDWNLTDPKVVEHLRGLFQKSSHVKRNYMALAGQKLKGAPDDKVFQEAWTTCFSEFKEWYESRRKHVQSLLRFYYGVKSETDFLEIIPCGHWKVDLLGRRITEKGLDTRMAVDMVMKQSTYDTALIICGDADTIPSVAEVRNHGHHAGTIEFLAGYPPEKRGGGFSSKLRGS